MSVSTDEEWKLNRDLSIKVEDRDRAMVIYWMNRDDSISDGNWI